MRSPAATGPAVFLPALFFQRGAARIAVDKGTLLALPAGLRVAFRRIPASAAAHAQLEATPPRLLIVRFEAELAVEHSGSAEPLGAERMAMVAADAAAVQRLPPQLQLQQWAQRPRCRQQPPAASLHKMLCLWPTPLYSASLLKPPPISTVNSGPCTLSSRGRPAHGAFRASPRAESVRAQEAAAASGRLMNRVLRSVALELEETAPGTEVSNRGGFVCVVPAP